MSTETPIRPGSDLAAEFWETGRAASCPVYDMHAHMGVWKGIYFPRAEAEGMVRSMDEAGVVLACFSHHAALFAPELGNAPAVEAVRAYPDRFRVYLGINPHYPDVWRRELEAFDDMRDVYVGLKFLADYHQVPITDERFRGPLEFAEGRELPVLLHTWGGSRNNGPDQVRAVAAAYPRVQFLCGHSFNPDMDGAVAVAREHPNTHLELCSIPGVRGWVEQLVEGVGSERVVYGTDLPWFSEHQVIGALLSALITEDDIHNILHRNAERLLAASGVELP